MASPIVTVKDGAGAATVTTFGNNVTPGNTVTISLASIADVDVWSIACISTDDQSSVASVNASLTIDPIGKTATFVAPVAGRAYRFQSVVNSGRDRNFQIQASYSTTFAIYTLVGGKRVLSVDETYESDPVFGWIGSYNSVIRTPAGVPSGSGVVSASGGSFTASAVVSVNEAGNELDIVGGSANSTLLRAISYNTSANGANVMLQHARGTPGAPTHTLSGDQFGGVYTRGYYDDASPAFMATGPGFRGVAIEDTTSISQGSSFAVTAIAAGATSLREVARFNADGTTRLYNPTGSFYYSIAASAIGANRNATLPLLTADDTFVMAAFAQALTNKTISGSSNTLSNIAPGSITPSGTNGWVLTTTGGVAVWAVASGGLGANVSSGSGYVAIGTAPAASGALRLTNNQFIVAKDASAADRNVIGIDASGYLTIGTYIQSLFGGDDLILGTQFGQIMRGGNSTPMKLTDGLSGITADMFQYDAALNADFTNSTTAFASSNLSFNMAASEVWSIEYDFVLQSGASATGIGVAIVAPSGASVAGYYIASNNSATPASAIALDRVTVLSPTAIGTFFSGAASQITHMRIAVLVTNGATAGTCALQIKSGTGGSVCRVFAGSKMRAHRAVKV